MQSKGNGDLDDKDVVDDQANARARKIQDATPYPKVEIWLAPISSHQQRCFERPCEIEIVIMMMIMMMMMMMMNFADDDVEVDDGNDVEGDLSFFESDTRKNIILIGTCITKTATRHTHPTSISHTRMR